jgi:SAM-dependent methyltransferase
MKPPAKKQRENQFEYPSFESLHNSEIALLNYYKFVSNLVSKSVPSGTKNILDFGAGQGLFTLRIMEISGLQPDCVEIDQRHRTILQSKGFKVFQDLEETTEKYDFIYSKDVLEHIEDDQGALKQIHEHLQPGGTFAVYVPALPIIYSGLDRSVGHFRRYKKKEMKLKLDAAGFKVITTRYVDVLGAFTGICLRFVGENVSEKSMNYIMFKIYDLLIFPISRVLDFIVFKNIVGKNLYVIATKK